MSRKPATEVITGCMDMQSAGSECTTPDTPSGAADTMYLPELLAGRRWMSRTDSIDVAAEIASTLDDIENREGCTTIKKNMVRAVYRFNAAGRDLIIKHFYCRSIRDVLKHLIVPDKSMVEWKAAKKLAAAGINVPLMRCRAIKRRGILFEDACLVMDAIQNCVHACSTVPSAKQENNPHRRREMLHALADVSAVMHRHGIFHSDFHGGNILSSRDEAGNLLLHVVDLHSVKFPLIIRYKHRVTTLMYIADALRDSAEPGEIQAICNRYARAVGMNESSFERFRYDVVRAALQRQEDRMKSRTGRCLKNSTRFIIERRGELMRRLREVPREEVLAAIEEHKTHALAADDMVVHRSQHDTVTRTRNGWCVKEWRSRGLAYSLRRIFDSKARAAWIAANGLVVRSIPTPQPVAMVDERRPGGSCYLVTKYVKEAVPLNILINELALRPESIQEQKTLACAVADVIANLHARDVHHHDLATKNFLATRTDDGWKVDIVDLDNVRFWRRLTLRRRLKALSQLNDLPDGISTAVRLAFVKRYNTRQHHKLSREDLEMVAQLTQKRMQARNFRPPQ